MKNLKCKVCEGNDLIEIYDKQFDMNYYRCKNCELIFVEDDGLPNEEVEIKNYNQHNNSMENEGYVNMMKDFISESIDPFVKDVEKSLEFGCGPGPVLAELLKSKGIKVDKYDKYFQPKKVYINKKYDLITCTEVIEHIERPLETMKLFYNHLKEDGILSMMTLFHYNDDERFKNWWYRREATHISFFNLKTFTYMAEKVGFKILFCDEKNKITLKK